ncbi:hypothetical protein [Alkalihalobacterium chitinilyticum]|uniref:Inhibitor of sigma-G Gin n=1 Tax=Alkalihalobacterium chitinilyticum TaxID=2980103 RepID=A0ABT5VAP6_9BACI|nr:hypothetical protein [Alkalihalobacterium chitinilyticum]MDE5412350.1 hypothetical protein [Alkalihalobacterium chitinilyticum]
MEMDGHRTYATFECDHCLIELTEHDDDLYDDESKEFYKSLAQMIVSSYDR